MDKCIINALVSIIFIIFVFSIWHNYYFSKMEHFQGKPPQNYIDLLPNSGSDIPKINIKSNNFIVSEVKRYFPSFIKQGFDKKRSGIPIKIEIVDKNAMLVAGWKVADELNEITNNQTRLLNELNESLQKSKTVLEITKKKCKI